MRARPSRPTGEAGKLPAGRWAGGRLWGTARGRMVGLMAGCALLNYVLRVSIGVLLLPIAQALGWGQSERSWFVSSFFVGYASLQLIGAWAATRYGGKLVLRLAIFGWAVCVGLLSAAGRLGTQAACGCVLLLGLFESPIMPALSHLQAQWVPPSQFSRAAAAIQAGCTLGAVLANLATPVLCDLIGWERVLLLYSAISAAFGVGWSLLASDAPGSCQSIGADELELLEGTIPKPADGSINLRLLASPAAGAVYLAHLASTWANYMLMSWLPTYYTEQLHTPIQQLGFYLTLPPAATMLGAAAASAVADRMIAADPAGSPSVRRLFVALGYGGAAVALVGFAQCEGPQLASVFLAVFYLFSGVSVPGWTASYLDLGGAHSGMLQGVGNTIATVSGVVNGPAVAMVLGAGGSWAQLLGSASVLLLLSVLSFHCLYTKAGVQHQGSREEALLQELEDLLEEQQKPTK